ncbi:FAD-linked oxidase [Sulfitobacter alexandrii]|uniref:FAD-linked oxidase n=1 Tax=Sulfitobacter alexandrii TaxID=1917485 RepID=A0A1J0WIH8_9RHOB|nr:FAD-binding oxidoreductase [Sulfitobacter alexandrii]APE44122.1 FAD-linked oxidase [Sulfitobacter alexandrii]
MTSISGKTDIDWTAFARSLAPVEVISEPVLVKKRSRDFFWYSPILNEQLRRCFGDLVAVPRKQEEMAHCLGRAYAAGVPVTLRGGGTGNYGQSVPLEGGLIIETTAMNRVLEIGEGFVRAEAGALLADVNAALAEAGQELAMFPSTQEIATIGGFVAGGSAGIGSLATGRLREPGNLRALKVLSVEADPQVHVFEGEEVLNVHHAWGLNGVITEVTMRTVPMRDWLGCMATFDSYADAYGAGHALATAEDIAPKLVSVVDARIAGYFPRLVDHIRPDRDLLVSYLPAEKLADYEALITDRGGHADLALTEDKRKAASIPHAFEFCYNHTTLQVLKSDRSATYQQIGVPDAADTAAIVRLRDALGEEVWTHHEFLRAGETVQAIDLPIIWYKGPERLQQINEIYAEHGFAVYDAHCSRVEGGGMHADYRHLAWKKRLDPKGLLNPGKSLAWPEVCHLSADEIAARQG